MADPEIRISVTAVTGEAAAALKSFADQQAAIQQRLVAAQLNLTQATNSYKDALKQLVPTGGAANGVNQQGLKILAEYKAQVDAAQASVAEETAALKALKPALTETTEQTELFAFAQGEASTQTGHLTQNLYAAQGASRLLSGNVPVRAFERFLSIIPGVSAALGAAFPIIGAIALIEIIGEGIEKIHKMRQEAEQAAENIDRAFRQMADGLRASNDELLTRTAHLQSELDRAYKKPGKNGAAEVFDEAAAAADRLGVSLDRDLEKLEQLTSAENKKDSIGFWASFFSGKAETGDTSAFIKKQVDAIRTVNDEYSDLVNRAAESGDKKNLASAQQDQLVALQNAYKKASDAIVADLQIVQRKQEDFKEGGWGEDQTAKINLLRGALNQLALEQKNIGEQYANQQLQTQVTHAKAVSAIKENYADELAAEHLAHGKSLGETVLYWEAVVEKTGKYHEQLLRAEEAFQKNLNEKSKFREALEKSEKKAEDIKPPSGELESVAGKLSDYVNRTGEAWERYNEQVARGREIQDQLRAQMAEVQVRAAEQSGAISKVSADHRLAAIHAKEYADRLYDLRQQLAALKAELPEARKTGKDPEVEAKIQSVQNQIDQTKGQGQIAGARDNARTAQDIAAPYIQATDMINNAWLQMQNKLIFGTRHIGQAFANMGVQMLESVARSFEQMLVKQLQYEIQSQIAHQVATRNKQATDAQAAAQGEALQRQMAIKSIFREAKDAAGAAYTGAVKFIQIPGVAQAVGAAAAATTFTAVMAFGAFEKGGIITGPTMALMGEAGSEAVLPHRLTNMLMSAANHYGGDTTNSNTSVHSTFNAHGITDRNFRDMARRHSDVIFDAAHSAVRTGKRRVG